MRKRRAAAVAAMALMVFVLFVAAEAGTLRGEPDGYGGLPWGTQLESVVGFMEYVGTRKENAGTAMYRRAQDSRVFGKARLKAVEYGFGDGKLTVVMLKVDSLIEYLHMKEEALKRFGPGREVSPRSERHMWEGDRTIIRLVSAFDLS